MKSLKTKQYKFLWNRKPTWRYDWPKELARRRRHRQHFTTSMRHKSILGREECREWLESNSELEGKFYVLEDLGTSAFRSLNFKWTEPRHKKRGSLFKLSRFLVIWRIAESYLLTSRRNQECISGRISATGKAATCQVWWVWAVTYWSKNRRCSFFPFFLLTWNSSCVAIMVRFLPFPEHSFEVQSA